MKSAADPMSGVNAMASRARSSAPGRRCEYSSVTRWRLDDARVSSDLLRQTFDLSQAASTSAARNTFVQGCCVNRLLAVQRFGASRLLDRVHLKQATGSAILLLSYGGAR